MGALYLYFDSAQIIDMVSTTLLKVANVLVVDELHSDWSNISWSRLHELA